MEAAQRAQAEWAAVDGAHYDGPTASQLADAMRAFADAEVADFVTTWPTVVGNDLSYVVGYNKCRADMLGWLAARERAGGEQGQQGERS